MAISAVQAQPARTYQTQSGKDIENKAPRKDDKASPAATGEAHKSELGLSSAKIETQRMIVERTLSHVEQEAGRSIGERLRAVQDMFVAAGKAEFEASAAKTADDLSPEATAGRIVEGITGYIFKAFQMQHPDMTEADFTTFQEQVMKGFDQGLEEAKDILTGLQAMTEERSATIDATESLVREQLDAFFKEQFDSLRKEAPDAAEA